MLPPCRASPGVVLVLVLAVVMYHIIANYGSAVTDAL